MEITLNHAPAPATGGEHPTSGNGKADAKNGESRHSPAVVVSLSLTAEEIAGSDSKGGETPAVPGKSVAHRARRILGTEQFAALKDMPFGHVVSALARGIDPTSLLPESETAPTADEAVADVAPAEEGTVETAAATEPVAASDATAESDTTQTTDADIALATLTTATGALDESV